MHRFYIPALTGNLCTLTQEESRHCVKVLRLKQTDIVAIIDGNGNLFRAQIQEASPRVCVLKIMEQHKVPPPKWELHIAIAPTKNVARMKWLLEKLTEIGITEFMPFVSQHSERKTLNVERLKKIAIEAMKQSNRVYLPLIRPIIPYTEVLNYSQHFKGRKFILHCIEKEREAFFASYKKEETALILIGPEGDFSDTEVQQALDNGFTPVTLGTHRLRTETAALAAACALHTLNEYCQTA